ncbi:MAG: MaoC family dehydratase [Nocardioidaceae bacterium]
MTTRTTLAACVYSTMQTKWLRQPARTSGSARWVEISQERIDAFADATGDHQWIHVDPEKAAGGPFGTTIAHGYLTLSMVPLLGAQVFAFAGEGAKINYGLNKVRFPAPVPVDSRVRAAGSARRGHRDPERPAGHPAVRHRDRRRQEACLRRRDGRPAARP